MVKCTTLYDAHCDEVDHDGTRYVISITHNLSLRCTQAQFGAGL